MSLSSDQVVVSYAAFVERRERIRRAAGAFPNEDPREVERAVTTPTAVVVPTVTGDVEQTAADKRTI